MSNFTFVDFFAGIGGFHSGLANLGGECLLACEIDKFAQKSYETLYSIKPFDDITKLQPEDVPDVDIIASGFPCQAFSMAGKRLGFADTRGTLFFEVARIAKEKQPKAMILENVKGLVNHDDGNTLDTIISALSEIGYRADFEIMNSKYFGVPQSRERIYIIAIREDLVEQADWEIPKKRNDVIAKGKRRISKLENIKSFNFPFPIQKEITSSISTILEEADEYYYHISPSMKVQVLAAMEGEKNKATIISHDDVARTLTTKQQRLPNAGFVVIDGRPRYFTHLESFRLQGFPDEYYYKLKEAGISNTQLSKQSGNAVSVPVVESLGKALLETLKV